jgi:hypothetical protein
VPRDTNCIVAVYSTIVGGILGLFGDVRLLGKIDDEQQVLAEPGGTKTRHKLPFLCFRFDPEKAQSLVLSRPAQGQYVEM